MSRPVPFAAKQRAFRIMRQFDKRGRVIRCTRPNAMRYFKMAAELSAALVEAAPLLDAGDLDDIAECLVDMATLAHGLVPT